MVIKMHMKFPAACVTNSCCLNGLDIMSNENCIATDTLRCFFFLSRYAENYWNSFEKLILVLICAFKSALWCCIKRTDKWTCKCNETGELLAVRPQRVVDTSLMLENYPSNDVDLGYFVASILADQKFIRTIFITFFRRSSDMNVLKINQFDASVRC